jgi:putative resolvase
MKLSAPAVTTIVVEHRDTLARFGSECFKTALSACGRQQVVMDQTEMRDDLVPETIARLTAFAPAFMVAARHRAANVPAAAAEDVRA